MSRNKFVIGSDSEDDGPDSENDDDSGDELNLDEDDGVIVENADAEAQDEEQDENEVEDDDASSQQQQQQTDTNSSSNAKPKKKDRDPRFSGQTLLKFDEGFTYFEDAQLYGYKPTAADVAEQYRCMDPQWSGLTEEERQKQITMIWQRFQHTPTYTLDDCPWDVFNPFCDPNFRDAFNLRWQNFTNRYSILLGSHQSLSLLVMHVFNLWASVFVETEHVPQWRPGSIVRWILRTAPFYQRQQCIEKRNSLLAYFASTSIGKAGGQPTYCVDKFTARVLLVELDKDIRELGRKIVE